jgi:hypothetical protein
MSISVATADGTTYIAPDDKVAGNNGLQVPLGTASTGPTAR